MNGEKTTLTIEYDENGEAYITFPEEILKQLDWKENDILVWIDNKDGSWSLMKKVDDESLSE